MPKRAYFRALLFLMPVSRQLIKCNVLAIVMFAMCLHVCNVAEASSEKGELTNGYFSPEEKSLTVSTLQAPSDFAKWLKHVDTRNAIKESATWNSFVEADVWIFFVRDIGDLYVVPDVLGDEFQRNYAPNALVAYRSFTINPSSTPEKKLALAFFMEELSERHSENAACVAAVIAYSFIFRVPVNDVERFMVACL